MPPARIPFHVLAFLAFLVACSALGPASAAESADGFVLPDVRLFDAPHARVKEGRWIAVRDGRIAAIAASEEELGEASADLPVLEEYRGAFVLPGLIDAHVHAAGLHVDALFLANGVTTVRDMGSFEEAALARLRSSRDDPDQPRYLVVGPLVDGTPPVWPFSVTPKDVDDAERLVARLAEHGVCAIKVYSRLPRNLHAAVVRAAHGHGLRAIGHVPEGATARDAITAGQDEIEHLDGVVDLLLPEASRPKSGDERWRRGSALWAGVGEEDLERVADTLAERGTRMCPTLAVLERTSRLGDPVLEEDPALERLPAEIRRFWDAFRTPADGPKPDPKRLEEKRRGFERQLRFVGLLDRAGVPILVGTDTPNPYVVPGASMHLELELLVRSGLTPARALAAATWGNARLLGIEDEAGAIRVGAPADLVILGGDPARNIADVKRVLAVSRLGRLGTPDELLAGAEAAEEPDAAGEEAPLPDLDGIAGGERIFRVSYEGSFAGRPSGGEEAVAFRTPEGAVRIVADVTSTFPMPTLTRHDILYDAEGRPRTLNVRLRRAGREWRARYVVDGLSYSAVVETPDGRRLYEDTLEEPFQLAVQSLAALYAWHLRRGPTPALELRIGDDDLAPAPAPMPEIEVEKAHIELPIGAFDGSLRRLHVEQGAMKFTIEFFQRADGIPLEMVVKLPFGDFALRATRLEVP